MAATDPQMQAYADQRIRVRAEQVRALINSILDDKSGIDDVYARAVSASRWNDARTDGPPHLLQSGNSANPDDALNFNAFLSSMKWLLTGIGAGDVSTSGDTAAAFQAAVQAQWTVLNRACVRPVVT